MTCPSPSHRRCALVQPPPSALQLAHRRKNGRLLTDLVAVFALPPPTSGSALKVLDLAHTWADRGDLGGCRLHVHQVQFSGAAATYSRTLPELLTAIAELLTRHQPHDTPALHTSRTEVTRAQFHFLEVLGFELAACDLG